MERGGTKAAVVCQRGIKILRSQTCLFTFLSQTKTKQQRIRRLPTTSQFNHRNLCSSSQCPHRRSPIVLGHSSKSDQPIGIREKAAVNLCWHLSISKADVGSSGGLFIIGPALGLFLGLKSSRGSRGVLGGWHVGSWIVFREEEINDCHFHLSFWAYRGWRARNEQQRSAQEKEKGHVWFMRIPKVLIKEYGIDQLLQMTVFF